MKKITALLMSIICIMLLLNATNIRMARGEVTARTYIESADYMSTELVSTDGEVWIVENYTAPIGDKVLIIYDKCSDDTIYDDEIVYIIHFTEIR